MGASLRAAIRADTLPAGVGAFRLFLIRPEAPAARVFPRRRDLL